MPNQLFLTISQRFEQKTNDKSSAHKLDTPVRVPASINMAAYTSTLVKEMEKENSGPGAGVPFVFVFDSPPLVTPDVDPYDVVDSEPMFTSRTRGGRYSSVEAKTPSPIANTM